MLFLTLSLVNVLRVVSDGTLIFLFLDLEIERILVTVNSFIFNMASLFISIRIIIIIIKSDPCRASAGAEGRQIII